MARPKRAKPPDAPPDANGRPHKPPGRKAAAPSELLSAADLPTTAERWLWTRRLMIGSVTLLAGDQSAGKSTLAAAVAAALTRGRPLPGGPDLSPRGVLWLGAEEDAAEAVRPRLRLAGADLARVYFPERPAKGGRRRVCLPLHAPDLLRWCRAYDVGLIVMDPITSHVEPGMLADSGSTARSVLESLTMVCQDAGACCLAIKHPRKGVSGSLIERISGSREWVQVPRCVLYLSVPDETQAGRVLIGLKPGMPRPAPSLACSLLEVEGCVRYEWGDEVDVDRRRVGRPEDLEGERDAAADALALLKSALENGPARFSDLERWAREAGVSMPTLRRMKERQGVTSSHSGNAEGFAWYWSAPEGGWK